MRLFLLLFSGVFSCLCQAGYKEILQPDPMRVEVYQLDNGLTVYLSKNTESPRFYAEIAVRAGSRHDPSDCTGLAHYLEHLLFKGTARMGTLDYEKEKPLLDQITALYEEHFRESDAGRRKEIYQKINEISAQAAKFAVANDIDRIYNFMGGLDLNAHTSYQETVYKIDLPANRLRHWAMIESERFVEPVFRLFHTELETVYEEKNQSLDNGNDQLYEVVMAEVFPGHPYGQQTTLGTTEHLKRPSLVRIREYFEKYYVPGNMAIIISGDIDTRETIKIIDESFGKWKPAPVPPPKQEAPGKIEGRRKVEVTFEGGESVLLTYQTAPYGHKDEAALRMMDMILDNSAAGLINLDLVQKQKVREAGSYPLFLNEAGAQSLWAIPREGQSLEEVEALLLETVEALKKGEFGDWILPAIVADFETNEKLDLESNESRVARMRDSFLTYESWSDSVASLSRIKAVTKEDVVRVAQEYLDENFVVGYLVDGKPKLAHVEKPQIDPVSINDTAESAFAKEVAAMPVEPVEPEFIREGENFTKQESPEGITRFTVANPVNDLFSLTWSYPIGSRHDERLALCLSMLDRAGVDGMSAEELRKRWYQLGLTLAYTVDDNLTEFTLSGLSTSMEEGVALMDEFLRQPLIDKETLQGVVADIRIQREDATEDPATLITALARFERYGKNSPFLKRMSSDEFAALTLPDLKTALTELFSHKHAISYVGPLEEGEWEKLLPVVKGPLVDAPATPAYPVTPTKESLSISFLHKEMAQAMVWIEQVAEPFAPEERVKVEMYNTFFDGGMAGIVFQELRESRGLAYSASGYHTLPRWQGDDLLVIGRIGCQADKTLEATKKFIELFDDMPASPVRFTEAREALANRYRTDHVGFRSILPTVQSWERQGLSPDPREEEFTASGKLTLEELLAFYQKQIKGRHRRVMVVGDRSIVGLEELKKIAPLVERKSSDIMRP
jgi:predicted Zn-dependent peptidase